MNKYRVYLSVDFFVEVEANVCEIHEMEGTAFYTLRAYENRTVLKTVASFTAANILGVVKEKNEGTSEIPE